MSTEDSKIDLASPADSGIELDEHDRQELRSELAKTEEEILTLRQVLMSKESHATNLKRRLGITVWTEFSEDMQQGLKSLQDTQAFKKTAEGLTVVKSKTASAWSTLSASQGIHSVTERVGSVFEAAKTKIMQPGAATAGAGAGAGDQPPAGGGNKNGQQPQQPRDEAAKSSDKH